MQFFPKLRASCLYGRALMRFHQKRYNDSARLLEKVCKLDSTHKRKELYYSYLGRSYLALGRYNDALELLSRAYELFNKQGETINDREYVELLHAFGRVLEQVGQLEHAREISLEAENYKRKIK